MLQLQSSGEGGQLQREDPGVGVGHRGEDLLPAEPVLLFPREGPGAQHHLLSHALGQQLPGDQSATLSQVNIQARPGYSHFSNGIHNWLPQTC